MKQIYPDLWVTEPEHLAPALPDLTLYAFLLVRRMGNVLFCRSEHHADHRHIKELGGITHQYLTIGTKQRRVWPASKKCLVRNLPAIGSPKRQTFYDGDRRGYPDYPSWHRMA
jgi:hypothetical protein